MTAAAQAVQSNLPKAVRKQAAFAQKAYEQAYGPKDEEKKPPVEAVEVEPEQEQEEEGLEQQEQQPVVAEKAEVAKEEPPPPKVEDWEQKYRTLQGMIQREAQEKKELQRELAGVQATLAALTDARKRAEEAIPTQKRKLRQEDIDSYGEDLINVIRAAAAEEFGPQLEKLEKENAQLRQQLDGVSTRAAQSEGARVEAFLTQQVPNWRTLNEDVGFREWLMQPDPFSGTTRQELLDSAALKYDAPRIAAFFTAYLNESQAIRGHQAVEPRAEPQGQTTRRPAVDKASLVAPGRPAMTGDGGAGKEEPEFFTQAQISEFYRDVVRGVYKTDPKGKAAKERAIQRAVAAGRVR